MYPVVVRNGRFLINGVVLVGTAVYPESLNEVVVGNDHFSGFFAALGPPGHVLDSYLSWRALIVAR